MILEEHQKWVGAARALLGPPKPKPTPAEVEAAAAAAAAEAATAEGDEAVAAAAAAEAKKLKAGGVIDNNHSIDIASTSPVRAFVFQYEH